MSNNKQKVLHETGYYKGHKYKFVEENGELGLFVDDKKVKDLTMVDAFNALLTDITVLKTDEHTPRGAYVELEIHDFDKKKSYISTKGFVFDSSKYRFTGIKNADNTFVLEIHDLSLKMPILKDKILFFDEEIDVVIYLKGKLKEEYDILEKYITFQDYGLHYRL